MLAKRASHRARERSGITLTEILIAILIMGVGLVSLATLFPLGMLRARRAFMDSRSALLSESAAGEMQARNLLTLPSFVQAGWYNVGAGGSFVDPWQIDFVPAGNGVQRPPAVPGFPSVPEAGLPVCYDPLWWSTNHQNGVLAPGTPATQAAGRFGIGLYHVRPDPSGGAPSAHGLQRITNFREIPRTTDPPAGTTFPFVYLLNNANFLNTPLDVFTSPDKILYNQEGEENPNQDPNAYSPVLPDLTGNGVTTDVEYAWFFTGQRVNSQDDSQYTGSVVVTHNRPMALETINTPFGGPQTLPVGERVVEAVWGYSGSNVTPSTRNGGNSGYGNGDRTVLLRWPQAMADPAVRPGSFIADVTYERDAATDIARFRTTPGAAAGTIVPGDQSYPGQRCDWYRVAGLGEVEPDPNLNGFRRMVVTLDTPVKAKTRLRLSQDGIPFNVNAALINAYVVNVFPSSFVNRNR